LALGCACRDFLPARGSELIRLSNGAELEVLVASGALAFDGRGWIWEWPLRWLGLLDPREFAVVVKTLTRHPRRGNLRWYRPWGCVRLIPGGVVNAVGLTNPGIEWWIRRCYPTMQKMGLVTIASIYAEAPGEAAEMAKMLAPLCLAAVELNASCPNTEDDLLTNVQAVVETARQASENCPHPLIIKLSYSQDYVSIAQQLEGVVEAVHAINTVPWRVVFPGKKSPLEHLGGGGVSGPVILPYAIEAVSKLSRAVSTPIIAGGGIQSVEDMRRLQEAGASAFSIGSLFLTRPWRPTALAREWKSLQRQGFESALGK
jgi:dihydroorotate dehydrogenase (NAD+) catalytic subunit